VIWQYKVVELGINPAGNENGLNSLGREGWELVAVTEFLYDSLVTRTAFLKKEKP
jgi:hypothetical protein